MRYVDTWTAPFEMGWRGMAGQRHRAGAYADALAAALR